MFMHRCLLALVVLVPGHSVPITGGTCLRSGYTNAWSQLLEPASIAKNDTRYGLHEGGPKYGLSAAETTWLASVTGHVICPGTKTLEGVQGSGSLIGRNDLIITNVHVVRNDDGSKRDDWPSCYFETQAKPPVRRKLKFFDPRTVFGTRDPGCASRDYALIRLEDPISGVEPIAVAADAGAVRTGQRLLVISSHQNRMKAGRKVLANEPIIQTCEALQILLADEASGTVVRSNCSSTGNASGLILLRRDDTNHLVAVGLHTGGGKREVDGQEFSPDPYRGKNSHALMFDGPFTRDLQQATAPNTDL